MIYTVSRTSLWGDEKPCEEAVKRSFENWDIRACSEEQYDREHDAHQAWRSDGKNHKITDEGYIARQFDDVVDWSVEINNLEELNSFIVKHGSVVISKNVFMCNVFDIEIYDDAREL